MKTYTGGTVMPQRAEELVKKKYERMISDIYDFNFKPREWYRWAKELTSLNAPLIDRRPKK
jgi:hypothetical protein